MAYYISETTATYDDAKLSALITLYSPENQVVNTLKIGNNQRTPQRTQLQLNKIGQYTFVFSNKSKYDMILDLVFAMTDCHLQKHKMHKKDVVVMQNRL